MKNLFILTLLTCSAWVYASAIEQHYYNEVDNAKAILNNKLASPSLRDFTEDDYCQDEHCRQQIHNPDQGHYFGDNTTLESDARQRLATDPYAANIVGAMDTRPHAKYKIDPNDPAFVNAKDYMDHSYEISHGISNKYVDCEGGNICKYVNTQRQCSESTEQPTYCISEPYVVSTSTKADRQTFTIQGVLGSFTLNQTATVTQIDTPTLTTGYVQNGLRCTTGHFNIAMTLWVNGSQVASFTGTRHQKTEGKGIFNSRCYVSYTVPARYTTLHPARDLHTFRLEIKANNTPLTLFGHGYVTAHFTQKTVQMGWRDTCKGIPNQCRQTQESCVEGAETRYINGVPVSLDCWKKKRTYLCQSPNTCAPLLNPSSTAPSLTCQVANKRCKTQLFGVCIENHVDLTCEERKCEQKNLTCGDRFFCLDGNCYDEKIEQNPNFSKSAAALAALGDAARSFSADKVRIFSGKGVSCSKKPVGFSDCCADKGWGQDIGLAQCSAEEKGLAQAKEKGLTIELGTYCAEKVLGVCIRKKKGYCQFDSKMARIVQEQGRSTLGLTFGSAKHPDCSGITPEQLQKLDFSKIDFSDFYQDLQNNMQLPSSSSIQQKIADKYKDLGTKSR